MNRRSWATLREHGVTEDADLRLDFFYVAPDEPRAKRLAAFLSNETDYDVHVHSTKTGLLKPKSWTVTGTTQDTKLSHEILDEWVRWMVAAGLEHECEFDGWGAQVP